jgi:hypothetical protein
VQRIGTCRIVSTELMSRYLLFDTQECVAVMKGIVYAVTVGRQRTPRISEFNIAELAYSGEVTGPAFNIDWPGFFPPKNSFIYGPNPSESPCAILNPVRFIKCKRVATVATRNNKGDHAKVKSSQQTGGVNRVVIHASVSSRT